MMRAGDLLFLVSLGALLIIGLAADMNARHRAERAGGAATPRVVVNGGMQR